MISRDDEIDECTRTPGRPEPLGSRHRGAWGPITVSRPNAQQTGWLSRWHTWGTTRHRSPVPPYAYVSYSDAARCLLCSQQCPLPKWAAQQRDTQNTQLQMGPCPSNPGWTHVWTPPRNPATGRNQLIAQITSCHPNPAALPWPAVAALCWISPACTGPRTPPPDHRAPPPSSPPFTARPAPPSPPPGASEVQHRDHPRRRRSNLTTEAMMTNLEGVRRPEPTTPQPVPLESLHRPRPT